MDSRDVRGAEPLSNALDYSNALASIDGMNRFASALREAPRVSLRDLAMGRQVAECLGSSELASWCQYKAEQYHVGNTDDPEYARYQLARMDIAELIPLMKLPGHMGWHVACRLAEFAFHQSDVKLLERAVTRMSDVTGVDESLVDPQLEFTIADISYHYLMLRAPRDQGLSQEQKDRLRKAMMRTTQVFRQRAALDLSRLYLNINYGDAA